jgi:hypothetical protein
MRLLLQLALLLVANALLRRKKAADFRDVVVAAAENILYGAMILDFPVCCFNKANKS